ncbi:hypothetical protein [Synechococcus sp. PCC 7336]|uniref:hypothetical protein n=1 Tax=Synechococcus sp. PCC 7336 TaxID=195250 RepID=UPI00034A631E|nr:hypothetical protein [Synechococcus sp. PCC 7336]
MFDRRLEDLAAGKIDGYEDEAFALGAGLYRSRGAGSIGRASIFKVTGNGLAALWSEYTPENGLSYFLPF